MPQRNRRKGSNRCRNTPKEQMIALKRQMIVPKEQMITSKEKIFYSVVTPFSFFRCCMNVCTRPLFYCFQDSFTSFCFLNPTNPMIPITMDTIPIKKTAGFPMKPEASMVTPHTMQNMPPGVIRRPPTIISHTQAKIEKRRRIMHLLIKW